MRIDKDAVREAAKKLRRLRLEDVGGRKERPAETVASVLKRGWNDDSLELVEYILRHGIKYYLAATTGEVAVRAPRRETGAHDDR